MKMPFGNKRASSPKQRKRQHLLDVKIRSGKAREQRNSHILTWSCVLILLASVVGGAYYGVREGLRRYLWENPEYQLKEIGVVNEGGSLPRDQIVEAAGVREGLNIFTINISKIRETLLRLPQVETAEVQRMLPNKIVITITERQPVAWVAEKQDENAASPGGSLLIDAQGALFQCRTQLPAYFHLPVIYGVESACMEPGQELQSPEIKAALDLIRLSNSDSALQTRFQATGIDVSKGYCLVVTDRNHAKITFGFDRLEWQLDRLMTLFDNIEQSKRELQTVNLMVQRNIPVTFVQIDPQQGDSGDSQVPPAKTEKPAGKKAQGNSKKSQTGGQKKSVPVKKANAVNDDTATAQPVKKAIPVNSPNTKSHG